MKNIGPFLDQQIDFTQLNDMFLVTGKTGSGKTTIFDAVTYALYGSIPGERNKEMHLHSDFVDQSEEAFVDLEFSLGQKRYRVRRDIQRTITSKNGTKKNSSVQAEFCAWDGKEWQSFEGTTTEKTNKIQNLIGLNSAEFTQIVLLPQGAFAEFLRKKPTDRKETLAKLFPVEFYTNICERVKEASKEQSEELKRLQKNLEEEQKDFNEEIYTQRLLDLTKQLEASEKNIKKYVEEIGRLSKEETLMQENEAKAKEALSLIEQKEELEKQKDAMQKTQQKLELAQKALLLESALNAKKHAEKTFTEQKKQKEEVETAFKEAQKEVQQLHKQKAEIETLTQKKSQLELSIHDTEQAFQSLSEQKQAVQEYEKEKSTFISLYEKIKPALFKANEELEQTKNELEQKKDMITKTLTMIEKLQEEKLHSEQMHTATSLVKLLKEGCPCPVCGSTQHPAPAKEKKITIRFEEEIKIHKDAQTNYENECEQLNKRLQELQQSKQEIQIMCDIIEQTANNSDIQLPEESALKKREDKTPNRKPIHEMKEKVTQTQSQLQQAWAKVKTQKKTNSANEEELKEKLTQEKKLLDEYTKRINSFQKDLSKAEQNYSAKEAQVAQLTQACEKTKVLVEQTEAEFNTKLSESAFETESAVTKALMDQDDFNQLNKSYEDYKDQYKTLCTKLEANKADPSQLGRIQKELSVLQEKIEKVQSDHEEELKKKSQLQEEKISFENKIKKVNQLTKECEQLQAKNEALFMLDNDVSGRNNPKKLPFDSWVLGTFFEDVVRSANVHFSTISSGRYRFNLDYQKESGRGMHGLDLTVTDSFTGFERGTSSLSGGETFMASLSLALALTDVVQAQTGGITLDSLFIDEGFGSLDGQALENAIAILDQIREHRTVGIISHIESLQQAILSQLHVEKTNTGSTIHII